MKSLQFLGYPGFGFILKFRIIPILCLQLFVNRKNSLAGKLIRSNSQMTWNNAEQLESIPPTYYEQLQTIFFCQKDTNRNCMQRKSKTLSHQKASSKMLVKLTPRGVVPLWGFVSQTSCFAIDIHYGINSVYVASYKRYFFAFRAKPVPSINIVDTSRVNAINCITVKR